MSSRQSAPLPVQLAKASWVAPLLVVLVNHFVRSSSTGGGENGQSVIFTVIALFFYLVGFVAALIALFSIPKYGTKGILLPAAVGLLLCGALLTFFTSSFLGAYQKARAARATVPIQEEATSPQEQLEQAAASLQEELPKLIDEETSLDSVTAHQGQLVYEYSLVNFSSEELDVEHLAATMGPSLTNQYCGQMQQFLGAGFTITTRYTTTDSVLVYELNVIAADCPSS